MTDESQELIGIHVRDDGGTSVIALTGDLDLASIDPVRAAIDADDNGDVRLDLSDVDYMDSSGLSLLIAQHRRLESEGRRLILRRPSEPVSQLLRIAGLSDYLHVELVGC